MLKRPSTECWELQAKIDAFILPHHCLRASVVRLTARFQPRRLVVGSRRALQTVLGRNRLGTDVAQDQESQVIALHGTRGKLANCAEQRF
jgi:hypothetical protein